jgi:hypothetical protein
MVAEKKAKASKKAPSKKNSDNGLPFKIAELAKHMKRAPATVRLQLREAKVKKPGKSYGWRTQTEMENVAKKLEVA